MSTKLQLQDGYYLQNIVRFWLGCFQQMNATANVCASFCDCWCTWWSLFVYKIKWQQSKHEFLKKLIIIIIRSDLWCNTTYLLLVYTTLVNSAFRVFWLVNSEMISKVLFSSEEPKRNKMASCFGSAIFCSASYSAFVVYILKQLFTSVSVKLGDIYLMVLLLGIYPLLFTSTVSVNNEITEMEVTSGGYQYIVNQCTERNSLLYCHNTDIMEHAHARLSLCHEPHFALELIHTYNINLLLCKLKKSSNSWH